MKNRVVSETDLVPTSWADGQTMTVEDWGQRSWESGIKAGYASGMQEASKYVMGLATDQFARGNDAIAKDIRKIADELRLMSQRPREQR